MHALYDITACQALFWALHLFEPMSNPVFSQDTDQEIEVLRP